MVSKHGIYAFAAIAAIIMILAACPDDSGDGIISTLNLSGRVHTRDFNSESIFILGGSFNPYIGTNDNGTISDEGMGGKGHISNGQLSYSIGKPADAFFGPLDLDSADLALLDGFYSNITISRNDAQAAFLNLTATSNGTDYILTRENITVALAMGTTTTATITLEMANYIYIDNNTTITAQGSLTPYPLADLPIGDILDDLPFDITADKIDIITNNINLKLRQGWNVTHSTLIITVGLQLALGDPGFTVTGISGKIGTTLGNPPSLKWTRNEP